MKRPGFFEGVVVALVIAAAGATVFAALASTMLGAIALKVVLSCAAGAYVVYLLTRSEHRAGRVAIAVTWLLMAVAAGFAAPTLGWFAIAHVFGIWLVRVLYFHVGFIGAVCDLGIGLIGLGAALLAATNTHSAFLVLWTFFLIQAAFSVVPDFGAKTLSREPPDGFDRAARTADLALRRLYS